MHESPLIAIVPRNSLCIQGTVTPTHSVVVDQRDRSTTYPNDYDYHSSREASSPDPPSDSQTLVEDPIEDLTLTTENAVALTRNVVEATRQEMRQTLRGTEGVGEALKLSLTIDLSRRGFNSMPEEMIQILKQDVERYFHDLPHLHWYGRAHSNRLLC